MDAHDEPGPVLGAPWRRRKSRHPVCRGARHIGAAPSRVEAGHGAARIDAPYIIFGVGMVMAPPMAAAIEAYRPVLRAALAPFASGHGYLNVVEAPADTADLFSDGDVYARLRSVKKQFDPGDVFRSNHPIPPAR